MMLTTFEAFRDHASSEAPCECCGLIVRVGAEERYWPCANTAENPEHEIRIREEDWVDAETAGEVLAICHSHTGSAEPGPSDLEQIQTHGMPWFILGDDTLQRIDPEIQPLAGRPFLYGWSDCYALVRDWYWICRGVRLPDFPREANFWEHGHSPYLDHFAACGFAEVDELMPGDLILMRIRSAVPNHAAIYTGEGYLLHHLWGRPSSRDLYSGGLQAATTHTLRLA